MGRGTTHPLPNRKGIIASLLHLHTNPNWDAGDGKPAYQNSLPVLTAGPEKRESTVIIFLEEGDLKLQFKGEECEL